MVKKKDILYLKSIEIYEDFRLWITCESHDSFLLDLLQMEIKVTNEPPKGIKARMYRTFTTIINKDFIEKVEPFYYWRSLVFVV